MFNHDKKDDGAVYIVRSRLPLKNTMTRNLSVFATVAIMTLGVSPKIWAQASASPQVADPAQPVQQNGLSVPDENFIDAAAKAGLFEIQGSQLALKKSARPEVKKFAQHMINDHREMAVELQSLVKNRGTTLPTSPSIVQTAKLKALSVRDDSFDKTYLEEVGVSAHQDAVQLFKKETTSADDPSVKQFAQKNLPILQAHLKMAQTLLHPGRSMQPQGAEK